jgi:hypothetical protein
MPSIRTIVEQVVDSDRAAHFIIFPVIPGHLIAQRTESEAQSMADEMGAMVVFITLLAEPAGAEILDGLSRKRVEKWSINDFR